MELDFNITIWQSLITMVMAYAAIASGIIFGVTEGAKKMFLTSKRKRDKYAPSVAMATAAFVAVTFWLWEGTYNPQGLAVYGLGSLVALFMSKGVHSDIKRSKEKAVAADKRIDNEKKPDALANESPAIE